MCHTAEATLDVFRPVIEDTIISRRDDFVWPPRICDFTLLDSYIWWLPSKISITPTSQRQLIDVLKDNIHKAIGEIQLHINDNVLKNWTDSVGYCMASHLNEIICHKLPKGFYFRIRKRNLRKYSVFLRIKKS